MGTSHCGFTRTMVPQKSSWRTSWLPRSLGLKDSGNAGTALTFCKVPHWILLLFGESKNKMNFVLVTWHLLLACPGDEGQYASQGFKKSQYRKIAHTQAPLFDVAGKWWPSFE